MNRKIAVLTAASALLALAACGTVAALDNGAPSPTPAPSGSATEHVHDDTHAHDEPSFVAGPVEDVLVFGQTAIYEDGLSVTASPAKSNALPGEWADGSTHPHVFTVKITNGSDEKYDPSAVAVSLQAGTVESEQILFFSGTNVGAPRTMVLPGRAVEFQVAFDVLTIPSDFVLEVSPDWNRNPVFFTTPTPVASASASPSKAATPKPSASAHKDDMPHED